jgi:hypothetical protein
MPVLSNDMDGERPPVTREVFEAMGRLLQVDYGNFVRYGLTQITDGSVGDELAKQMVQSSWPPRTGAGRLVPTPIRKSPLSRSRSDWRYSASRGWQSRSVCSCASRQG